MSRFQILCLSGGGFRGLYTAEILRRIEKQSGRPIGECFDLICGTSIGGILATGLAFGESAENIHKTLRDHGHRIFTKQSHGWKIIRRLTFAPYSNEPLKKAIETLVPTSSTIKQALHPYLTTAINLHTGKPRVFKTPHHESYKIDGDLLACEAALATSAAPTFFPPAKIGSQKFVDGGLYANTPVLVGLHEAEHFLKVSPDNIHVLSIGTTGKLAGFGHAELGWGLTDWFQRNLLIDLTFSAQAEFASNILRHKLGDRYLELNESYGDGNSFINAMDDTSDQAVEQLEGMAERSYMNIVYNPIFNQFFTHKPARTGLKFN